MKINGTDISVYKARQMNVVVGHSDLETTGSWIRGSVTPTPNKSLFSGKEVSVTLAVHGNGDRESIIINRSKIIQLCKDEVDLTLDGFKHKFKGWLTSVSPVERTIKRWHNLTLTFLVYEYGTKITASSTRVTASSKTTLTINNTGTAESPLILTISPAATKATLTIKGACVGGKNIVIPNMTSGKQIILNGQTGLFTEAGKLKEMTIWKRPSLLPGSTTIEADSVYADMTAEVIPIYL